MATFVTAALVALPLIALVVIAGTGSFDGWDHIWRYVLPRTVAPSLTLMLGVAVLTAVIGTVTAFLVGFYDFPLRRPLSWMLLLPLAVPGYIAAYSFVEFLSFTGPPQSLIRALTGATSARDYWFPSVRSVGGAITVLSLTLYPYVYLTVRASFAFQGQRQVEAARLGGAGPWRLLFKICLPLARPAIAVGVVLALMETVNDVGAVEFLGVNTLTFAVFSTWLNQGNMAGAAQLALLLFAVVLMLILFERLARRRFDPRAEKVTAGRGRASRRSVRGAGGFALTGLVALPILLGFLLPVSVLLDYASRRWDGLLDPRLWGAAVTTSVLAVIAALAAAVLAVLIAYGLRVAPGRGMRLATRIASSGYAIPGTIIALGIFLPLARVDALLANWLGLGLLLTGSGATLIYAYVVRFLAIAEGNLSSGLGRISISVDSAAQTLGRGRAATLHQVLLPLLRPAIAAAALLVFIDVVKELSATILLRPFGLSTLSTYIYEWASSGRVEDAAIACLLMVTVAILPIAFLSRRALEA